MTIGKLIKILALTEDVTLTDLAKHAGISRQGMYRRLDHGIGFEAAKELIEFLGYELYYGKDGEIKKI